jgi:hypothetical protein
MDNSNLCGKIFSENELYELLLFDIESNFSHYYGLNLHIYFDRIENQKIKITEIIYFKNKNDLFEHSCSVVGKRNWFEITPVGNHINLYLTRLDRNGKYSAIFKDRTRTEEAGRCWPDEMSDYKPMTEDELRQAFRELAGMFEEPQNSRSKKAV